MTGLLDQVAALCARAASLTTGEQAAEVRALAAHLDGPLRVAIAGRVNAGKSTLLNALVGERLAPTDAGECTRVVTWYQEGIGYEVTARLDDGSTRPVPFDREDGALAIDIPGVDDVDELIVSWPSRRLATMTLIDTPGLEGHDPDRGNRARRFLGTDGDHRHADAVIYLMRHLHARDADFLETFGDSSLPRPSPANAVAVLSRADEIGGGRLDSLASAGRIAGRYSADPRVRSLCATVVPVAGLIAETAVTLQEHEAASLQAVAALGENEREGLLLSVDRFCAPGVPGVPAAVRRSLLARLGLFGVRYCVSLLADGTARSAAELSELLIAASGVRDLVATLDELFTARAAALKAQTVLGGLTGILAPQAPGDPAATELLGDIERLEMGAAEFVLLRLSHIARDPGVSLGEDERAEIDRLAAAASAAQQLGLGPDAAPDAMRGAALAGVARWRAKAEHPLTAGSLAEVCDLAVRVYEGMYAAL